MTCYARVKANGCRPPGGVESGHGSLQNIASRTYNHGWRLDPIVRSLLDTDFYKLLMQQMIREFYPEQHTTFSVINPQPACAARRDHRRRRAACPARSCPRYPLQQERADLARR